MDDECDIFSPGKKASLSDNRDTKRVTNECAVNDFPSKDDLKRLYQGVFDGVFDAEQTIFFLRSFNSSHLGFRSHT